MNGRRRVKKRQKDIHDKIKNTMPRQQLQILVGLPPLCCSVHIRRLLQCWKNGENQQCSCKDKIWNPVRPKWEIGWHAI